MKTIPVESDQPQTDPGPETPGGRAPIKPDPLSTLKLKPPIIETLSTIYDPEIPVNIYDLGLIYDVLVDEASNVEVRMTLTAPGCPAAQTLPGEVQRKVAAVPGVASAWVELVWEPPWDRDRMSETAKLQLGML